MPKSIQSPGTVLKLFLRGYNLNPTSLARELKLSQATIRLLTLDKTKISIRVALLLAKFFDMKPQYWLDLQNNYDLSLAANDKKLAALLKSVPKAKKPTAAEKAAAKKSGPAKKTAKPKAPAKEGGAEEKAAPKVREKKPAKSVN
ncbi:MAG: HigA family addiction module antidote protein [Treponema sp.]|jgi:addiction module HigA family antidote|nr:HigA family addiction module antidote protein [Treponema sp.]